MRKPAFCIYDNKGADQHGNCTADQRLHYRDSAIPLLLKSDISSLLPSSDFLWLYSLVCIGPGRKPQRQVFS